MSLSVLAAHHWLTSLAVLGTFLNAISAVVPGTQCPWSDGYE